MRKMGEMVIERNAYDLNVKSTGPGPNNGSRSREALFWRAVCCDFFGKVVDTESAELAAPDLRNKH